MKLTVSMVVFCPRIQTFFFFFFFSPSHLLHPSTTLARPPIIVVAHIGGSHCEPSPPLPITLRAFIFISTRRIQHFLPYRRPALNCLVPTHLLGTLLTTSSFYFWHFCKYSHISPRWESNSRTDASRIFEGNHEACYER